MARIPTILALVLLFISSSFSQCANGDVPLEEGSIHNLPQDGDLTIAFGTDFDLDISTLVVRTDPPRDNFEYKFVNPSDSAECTDFAAIVEGAEIDDPEDPVCNIPITSEFDWPPEETNCFARSAGTGVEYYDSNLVLSWEESFDFNGAPEVRQVSVTRAVRITMPTEVEISSADFKTATESSIDLITGFLITGAHFEKGTSGIDFTFSVKTITDNSGDDVAILAITALPGDDATPTVTTDVDTGGQVNGNWVQNFEFSVNEECLGGTFEYHFRATFVCKDTTDVDCDDYPFLDTDFQQIDLTVTIGNVCPQIENTETTANPTLILTNGADNEQYVFSATDTIKAVITGMGPYEDLMESVTVNDDIDVNTDSAHWSIGTGEVVEYNNDNPTRPIVVFADVATLMASGLHDGADLNIITLTLTITWDTGSVTKKDVRVSYQPTATAKQSFNILPSNNQPVSAASSLTASLAAFVVLALFLVFM